ncbi:MAG: reactive intermediate/imine deaminase [Magnetococcales bacterium]|nr:reactive intermediate/imine deaminase [Magnetococcales bacterium]
MGVIYEVATGGAPGAIGPYSQGVLCGGWLWVSGQIPLDPVSGRLVDGDMVVQVERVLENVGAILAGAGAGFADVVKTTIYLIDMNDFSVVNEVYGRYFVKPYPARATVGVMALPKGVRIEMDVVARVAGQVSD